MSYATTSNSLPQQIQVLVHATFVLQVQFINHQSSLLNVVKKNFHVVS